MAEQPRSVLVTGASRGLGLGIARTLAGSGYRVIGLARKKSPRMSPRPSLISNAPSRARSLFVPFDLA